MQNEIPPYSWIIAHGLTRSSIEFVCACYEYSKNHAEWSRLDVRTHLTKRALDAASAAHAEADSSLDIIPANVAGSQPRQ